MGRPHPGPARGRAPAEAAARVVMPVFNDWVACGRLLENLDRVLGEHGLRASVLLIDDGSTTAPTGLLMDASLPAIDRVDLLVLRRNLGHQRAISVGLAYLAEHAPDATVVLMDSDGEDDPADIPRLLQKYREDGGEKIVFAERTRRSEGLVFRTLYMLYKVVHRLLTGRGVRVGNFSVIPASRLRSLVVVPELWNHYAAAVFVSRLPFTTLPTHRGKRLAGESKMNFVGLVMHGLSAISVFSDVVGTRVLLATLVSVGLALLGIMAVVAIRIFTQLAIPGWATYTTGLLLVMLLQTIMFAFVFTFTILAARKAATILPAREYEVFIDRVCGLFPDRA